MFAAGAFGYRGGWMIGLPERFCARWASAALVLAVPLFAALLLFGGALQGQTARYVGGFNLVSAGKCLWEALVCVGMGLLILAVYRRHFDQQGEVARWLSDNAFGVYLIHPPVLIGFAILLHGLALYPVLKAAFLTLLAAVGSFAASAFVLRKSAAATDHLGFRHRADVCSNGLTRARRPSIAIAPAVLPGRQQSGA